MNRRRFVLALAACSVWAGACLASGDEKSAAAPVVYLGRSSVFALPGSKGVLSGRMLRELARQSFLVTARDQLGLRTRDVSLGDEMPGEGEDVPFEVLTASESQPVLDVRQGFAPPGKTLLHEVLGVAPAPPEDISRGKFVVSIDYRAVLVEMEKLSRGKFVEAVQRAGFQGKPNALRDAAGVPQEIEQALQKMDFMSQFSAVRQLHELVRADGQSPERLGALVRGYANLGLLTEFHWHPAHKAFKARALVYAQRMVSSDKQPWRAAWHRAYAFALAGLHRLALDDLETAGKQWQAAAKDGRQRPAWVDLIDAYCRFAHARLHAAGEEGPEKNLAQLLWFDSIQHSYHTATIIQAAIQMLQKHPGCFPALDALCEHGGVSVGHAASSAPLVVAGKMLYVRALAIPGLPPAAVKIARAAGEGENADDDEGVVKEFSVRAKLIRALLESDGSVPAKAAGAAPPAKPPADAAALDRGEPSWVCLGRLVSNLSFVHAWRRAYFLQHKLGVPTDDFIKQAAPLVEAHPYRQYLATYSMDPAAQASAWEKVTIPEPDDLEYQEAFMWLQYQSRHLPAAAGMHVMVASRQDHTPRDCYTLANNGLAVDHLWWSAVLLRASPFSPVGPAFAVEFCGDDYKARFAEWEKAAADYPAVALAFARRAKAAERWEEAEKWLKLVAAAGDIDAIQQLATLYALQGKWDLWVATLEESLKAPDFGLSHARARTCIARYYMHGKQWEKALPYATAAAEAYSEWGLRVLAECREAMHDWTAAEAIYKAMGERYPMVTEDWYAFCRRSGRGDLDAARRAAAAVIGPRRLGGKGAIAYYLLEKDPARARMRLEFYAKDGNPVCDLHVALLADQAHDNATRDKILDRVKQKAAQYRLPGSRRSYASLAALAGLMADDLAKGGKGEIDLAAAERLSPPQPFTDDDPCRMPESKPVVAFAYLLGRYLDLHGKPELAVRCWQRCLAETDAAADLHRTLAAAELLGRGIKLEAEEPRPEEGAAKPKSPP
jgi:hypothetical protein